MLLRVREDEGLETLENNGICSLESAPSTHALTVTLTVGNNDTVFALNRFVCDGFCEIDREEYRVHLSSDRIERRFEKYFPFVNG